MTSYLCKLFTTIFILTLFVIFTSQTHASTPGLIASYGFNDSANPLTDSSGNNSHASCSSCPTYETNSGHLSSGTYNFSGSGNYIALPNESQFDFSKSLTVMTWIKVNGFDSYWEAIVTKGDSAWGLSRFASSSTTTFDTFSPAPHSLIGSDPVDNNQWHHIAIVYTGTQKLLYVDGQLDNVQNYNKTLSKNNLQVWLGYNQEYTISDFSGLMDDVRIYSTALSQSQVQADMNTPVSNNSPTPTNTPTQNPTPTSTPTTIPTSTTTPTPTLTPTPTTIPTDTLTPTLIPTNTPTLNPTITNTPTPTPTNTPTPTSTPTLIPTPTTTPNPDAIQLAYAIDRSQVPSPLYYQDLTLNINVGTISSAQVITNGNTIPHTYNSQSGTLSLTTSANTFTITLHGAQIFPQLGEHTKASLLNNKSFAWSHGMDDNVFLKAQTDVLNNYNYQGTYYLIANQVDDTRDESWIIDAPYLSQQMQLGWSLGNHTWDHACFGDSNSSTVIQGYNRLRQILDNNNNPNYQLISFAAPCFSTQYHQIIQNHRNNSINAVKFNESGNRTPVWIDPGSTTITGSNQFDIIAYSLDYDAEIGRNTDIDNGAPQQVINEINQMADQYSQHGRHLWLNTLTHGDKQAPLNTVASYVHNNYGQSGTDQIWVAPADRIYSYLLTRDYTNVQLQSIGGTQPTPTPTPTSQITPTPTIINPTPTPTNQPTPTPTTTITPTPTNSPTPTPTPTSTPTPSANPGLIASYGFNNSSQPLTDSSGNNNHANCSTCPTYETSTGHLNSGTYNFSGSGNFITLPNESQFDFTNSLTVMTWIKVNGFDTPWETIITKGDSAWGLSRLATTSNPTFTTFSPSPHDLTSSNTIDNNQWHHIAIVYTGTQKRLYINGNLASSANYSQNISQNNLAVRLGQNQEYTVADFSGHMDDVRIYSTALTQTQIQQDMNTPVN